MIQQINIENDTVLAFRVDGKVSETDVKQSIGAVLPELKTPAQFNLYVEVVDLDGIEPAALKERMAFAVAHFQELLKQVNKVALVTDKSWMQNLATVMYGLIPGIEQTSFSFAEADKAKQWLAS